MDETQVKKLIKDALKNQVRRETDDAKEAAVYVGACGGGKTHTKIRGCYVFRLASLDRWMDEQEQANTELRRQHEAALAADLELAERGSRLTRAGTRKALQGTIKGANVELQSHRKRLIGGR